MQFDHATVTHKRIRHIRSPSFSLWLSVMCAQYGTWFEGPFLKTHGGTQFHFLFCLSFSAPSILTWPEPKGVAVAGSGKGREPLPHYTWQMVPPMSFPVKSCTFSLQLSERLAKGKAPHCSLCHVISCSVAVSIAHHQPQQQVRMEGGSFSPSLSCVILVTSSLLHLGVWERKCMKEEKDDSPFVFCQDLDLYRVIVSAESHVVSVLFLLLCLLDTRALHGIQTVDLVSVGQLAPSPIILLVGPSGPNTSDYCAV